MLKSVDEVMRQLPSWLKEVEIEMNAQQKRVLNNIYEINMAIMYP